MKPYDFVKDISLTDRELTFGKLLKMEVGEKYIACDIFANRFFNVPLNYSERAVKNVISNIREFCDAVEKEYETL